MQFTISHVQLTCTNIFLLNMYHIGYQNQPNISDSTSVVGKILYQCNTSTQSIYWTREFLLFSTITWKQPKRCASCSGEKYQASLMSMLCTFLTMISRLPSCEAQMRSKSSTLRAFSLMQNRSSSSSFSIYWGWCRLSWNTMDSTLLLLIHSCECTHTRTHAHTHTHTHTHMHTTSVTC